MKKVCLLLAIVVCSNNVKAQRFLMDMVDTTTELGKGMLAIYQKFGSISFSAYIQPQFQVAEAKGAKSFGGGDFLPNSNSRFMLRRSRIRTDYAHYNKRHELASYFVFQVDANERGVNARDVWGKFFENKWQLFSFTTGLFARPFGYEVNLSSSDRESPERGRMSQTIMKVERDLGFMATFEPRKADARFKWLKVDLGIFNGQGLAGPMDYDSYKDIIGRIALKPSRVNATGLVVSAGTSILYGGIGSQSPWKYQFKHTGDQYTLVGDSSTIHQDSKFPRQYYGADIQVKLLNNNKWTSELRAEIITGTQTATATSSETPGSYPVDAANVLLPLHIRQFNGAYFYFLQNIVNKRHQLVFKYDWYDPNTKLSGTEVSKTAGASVADVRYDTFGFGYLFYANPHLRLMLYYDRVVNETTALTGYTSDAPDDLFTCRLQFRF